MTNATLTVVATCSGPRATRRSGRGLEHPVDPVRGARVASTWATFSPANHAATKPRINRATVKRERCPHVGAGATPCEPRTPGSSRHPGDVFTKLRVAMGTRRPPAAVRFAGLALVRRRGDRQLPADRLDPVLLRCASMNDVRSWVGSRAPPGRNTDAYVISVRPTKLQVLPLQRLDQSRSWLVSPGRRPWSRSACRTHLRSVSAEQPAPSTTRTAHCVSPTLGVQDRPLPVPVAQVRICLNVARSSLSRFSLRETTVQRNLVRLRGRLASSANSHITPSAPPRLRFDELSEDTPLNRVLKAAVLRLAEHTQPKTADGSPS